MKTITNLSRHRYCKDHKKTVKTGQTLTRERKECKRARRLLSMVNIVNPCSPSSTLPAPGIQNTGVTKNDFESYVKANDAVMRNMQEQNQNLQNQMTNLMDMLSKFVNSNNASTSGSWTFPSNTITNPKVDLKGIYHPKLVLLSRTHDSYYYSSPPKVMEREFEVTKDTVLPTNNGSTKDV
ncbi:hypothetical protein Tco_0970886 [Tanacetum coccineum]